jgi:hypothetical protein
MEERLRSAKKRDKPGNGTKQAASLSSEDVQQLRPSVAHQKCGDDSSRSAERGAWRPGSRSPLTRKSRLLLTNHLNSKWAMRHHPHHMRNARNPSELWPWAHNRAHMAASWRGSGFPHKPRSFGERKIIFTSILQLVMAVIRCQHRQPVTLKVFDRLDRHCSSLRQQ